MTFINGYKKENVSLPLRFHRDGNDTARERLRVQPPQIFFDAAGQSREDFIVSRQNCDGDQHHDNRDQHAHGGNGLFESDLCGARFGTPKDRTSRDTLQASANDRKAHEKKNTLPADVPVQRHEFR